MEQMIVECPACGSTNINNKTLKRKVQAPFGKEVERDDLIIHCNDCNEDYNQSEISDIKYLEAFSSSTKSSIPAIIDYISHLGYSFTELER